MAATASSSVLAYYRENRFNPVLIPVEQEAVWVAHYTKRRNLYERHLRLPPSLLRDRRVLEFGPNSGENALVLALHGARLTLVEPNEQVIPRLYELFDRFGVRDQLESVRCSGISAFESNEQFDLVIAEGFLYTLPDRDDLLRRLTRLVAPGMFGIVSSNDLHGGLIELLRRAVLYRVCRLSGVADEHSPEGLALARQLYLSDFGRLNSSRTFEAWWKDTLVNPFYATECLWSFPTLFGIMDETECRVHGCSPDWLTVDHHDWYKNVSTRKAHAQRVERNWKENFAYVLTGQKPDRHRAPAADDAIVESAGHLSAELSDLGRSPGVHDRFPQYPVSLDRFLNEHTDPVVRMANSDIKVLVAALAGNDPDALIRAYANSTTLRGLWGTAYHYLSFVRAS